MGGRFYTCEPQTKDPDESSLTFEQQKNRQILVLSCCICSSIIFIILFKTVQRK